MLFVGTCSYHMGFQVELRKVKDAIWFVNGPYPYYELCYGQIVITVMLWTLLRVDMLTG